MKIFLKSSYLLLDIRTLVSAVNIITSENAVIVMGPSLMHMLKETLKLIPGGYMNFKMRLSFCPCYMGVKIGLHSEDLGYFGKECCGK